MRTPLPKKDSLSNPTHSPFFQKERGNNFFGKSNKPKPFFNSNPIQTKLSTAQPNDIYEKEADATADKVVQRLSDNSFSNGKNNSKPSHGIVQRKLIVKGSSYGDKIEGRNDQMDEEVTNVIARSSRGEMTDDISKLEQSIASRQKEQATFEAGTEKYDKHEGRIAQEQVQLQRLQDAYDALPAKKKKPKQKVGDDGWTNV